MLTYLTLDDISRVHKPRGHEPLLPVGPDHPGPVRVLLVQDRHEVPPFYTHVILVPRDESVQHYVLSCGGLGRGR